MASRKPPVWEWEGETSCPECGETALFLREDGFQEISNVLAGANWVVQLFHRHDQSYPEGQWNVAVYRTYKGRQKPQIVKDAKGQKSEAYKQRQARRQIANASAD